MSYYIYYFEFAVFKHNQWNINFLRLSSTQNGFQNYMLKTATISSVLFSWSSDGQFAPWVFSSLRQNEIVPDKQELKKQGLEVNIHF